ncbi:hypothetical protein E3P99_03014 [Wallemia hederae]|uniref:Chromatin modification-related protein n=1 Tax=Wallemia hederae TaxID=1540922 RepID=A0A4T0FHX3_9BASI|nr:hypothetical protein E3P99_03014 [Wallemia hederae]
MDEAGIVATEFLGSLDNLQLEFKFILNEVRVRDDKCLEMRDKIQSKEVELNKASTLPEENTLSGYYDTLETLSNEKLFWSNKLDLLMKKHLKRLDLDLVSIRQLSSNLNPMHSTTTPLPLPQLKQPQQQPQSPAPASVSTPTAPNPKKRKLSSTNQSTSKKSRNSSIKPEESEEEQSMDGLDADSISDSTKNGAITDQTGEQSNDQDEDDAAYCYCQKKSYGNMIGCENDDCPIQWFHFGCVNIKPPEPDVWFCSECKSKLGLNTQTPSKKAVQALKKKK